MKKISFLILVLVLVGCGSKSKITESKPLYETLSVKEDGGATIRFFEILSEPREIKMLQNDADLRKKINADDITTSNFVILNMGEQTTLGYSIAVESIKETPDKILIKVKENSPKTDRSVEKEVFYYPYTIIKVNSKKPLIIE